MTCFTHFPHLPQFYLNYILLDVETSDVSTSVLKQMIFGLFLTVQVQKLYVFSMKTIKR